MILKILIAVAAIVAVLVVVIVTRPSAFRVERTATISAPAPAVFDAAAFRSTIFTDQIEPS